jgi:hypothetical protein
MDSTARSASRQIVHETAAPPLRWRSWPLVAHARWSWIMPIAIVAVGAVVWYLGGGLLIGLVAIAGLAATLWQFFLPVSYEIDALGLRRYAAGRTRLIPWHAVRAYRVRPSGIVLYQRGDPTKIDLLRSLFVPFPADEDEMLCAMREHLPHAMELQQP